MASAKFTHGLGRLQEETTALGYLYHNKENTERPITISEGTNRLIGSEMNEIIKGFNSVDEQIIETHYRKIGTKDGSQSLEHHCGGNRIMEYPLSNDIQDVSIGTGRWGFSTALWGYGNSLIVRRYCPRRFDVHFSL